MSQVLNINNFELKGGFVAKPSPFCIVTPVAKMGGRGWKAYPKLLFMVKKFAIVSLGWH